MTHRIWQMMVVGTTVLLGASVGRAEAQSVARRIGFGASSGYNAPTPIVYEHSHLGGHHHHGCWKNPSLQFGCADIPANWRTHVWDDYPNEPLAQRWAGNSLHPVAPVPPPMKTIFKRQAAAGSDGFCPHCQPNPGMPMAAPSVPVDDQPVEEAVAPTSARRVQRDRST